MKQSMFTLTRSSQLTPDTWELVLEGDTSAVTAPGQFVSLALADKFLRRPISVCDWDEERLILLVKEAGDGTRELVRLPAGARLDVLSGLGSGFDVEKTPENPVLVGGGIGAAPLVGLAKRMLEEDRTPTLVLGFGSARDVFYLRELAALGVRTLLASEDGSVGTRGLVTDVLAAMEDGRYVCACGPEVMLKAVAALPQTAGGQFSLEARMACGFGACMGCTIETKNGLRRVCKDGPVFQKEELLW